MRRIAVLLTVLGAGCATTGGPATSGVFPSLDDIAAAAADTNTAPIAIPDDLKPDVGQSERMGKMLFEQQSAVTLANEVVAKKTTDDERAALAGSIAQPEANEDGSRKGSWLVMFLTADATPKVAYRVRVMPESRSAEFEKVTPPGEVAQSLAAMIQAQKTAIAAAKATSRAAQQPLSPVVFPVQMNGQNVHLVYLIATSPKSGTAILGQHFRVFVSEDGKEATKTTALSHDALELPASGTPSTDGKSMPLMVVQQTTDWPTEGQVLASLQTQKPIYVGTQKFIWQVDGASISLLRRNKEPEKPGTLTTSDRNMLELEQMNRPDQMQ